MPSFDVVSELNSHEVANAVDQANREIADELVVVLDTVKKHVRNILRKLGACNRTHSVARARALGLLQDPRYS